MSSRKREEGGAYFVGRKQTGRRLVGYDAGLRGEEVGGGQRQRGEGGGGHFSGGVHVIRV